MPLVKLVPTMLINFNTLISFLSFEDSVKIRNILNSKREKVITIYFKEIENYCLILIRISIQLKVKFLLRKSCFG